MSLRLLIDKTVTDLTGGRFIDSESYASKFASYNDPKILLDKIFD